MKLSLSTMNVLANLSEINNGVIIPEGNQLTTISIQKNIYASVKVADTFPRRFAIYDLKQLLSTINMVKADSLEIDFQEDHLQISTPNSRIRYMYSSERVIISPNKEAPKLPSPDCSFILTKDNLLQVKKAEKVMALDTLYIKPNKLEVGNSSVKGNSYEIDVDMQGEVGGGTIAAISLGNMKLMPELDYTVNVYSKGAASFTSTNDEIPIQYLISIEANA